MFPSFKLFLCDWHCIGTVWPIPAFRIRTPVIVPFQWIKRSVSEGVPTFETPGNCVHNHSTSPQSVHKCRWFRPYQPCGFTLVDAHFRQTSFFPQSGHRFLFHSPILRLIHSIMLMIFSLFFWVS